jgi:hypothetical protein
MRGRRFFIKSKSSQLPNNNGSNHVTDNSSLAYQSLKNLVLPEIKTTFPTSTAKRAAFTPEIEALTKDPDLEPEIDMHPAERSPDLRGKSDEEAVELMREWFFENFEDPANNMPYEGEYIYVWGGPYYAEEELRAAFEDTATPEALTEIISDIEHEGYEWAPSDGRLGPIESKDKVVRTKRRLFIALRRWDEVRAANLLNGKPGADFAASEVMVRVSDVTTALRELHTLKRAVVDLQRKSNQP